MIPDYVIVDELRKYLSRIDEFSLGLAAPQFNYFLSKDLCKKCTVNGNYCYRKKCDSCRQFICFNTSHIEGDKDRLRLCYSCHIVDEHCFKCCSKFKIVQHIENISPFPNSENYLVEVKDPYCKEIIIPELQCIKNGPIETKYLLHLYECRDCGPICFLCLKIENDNGKIMVCRLHNRSIRNYKCALGNKHKVLELF